MPRNCGRQPGVARGKQPVKERRLGEDHGMLCVFFFTGLTLAGVGVSFLWWVCRYSLMAFTTSTVLVRWLATAALCSQE